MQRSNACFKNIKTNFIIPWTFIKFKGKECIFQFVDS